LSQTFCAGRSDVSRLLQPGLKILNLSLEPQYLGGCLAAVIDPKVSFDGLGSLAVVGLISWLWARAHTSRARLRAGAVTLATSLVIWIVLDDTALQWAGDAAQAVAPWMAGHEQGLALLAAMLVIVFGCRGLIRHTRATTRREIEQQAIIDAQIKAKLLDEKEIEVIRHLAQEDGPVSGRGLRQLFGWGQYQGAAILRGFGQKEHD
jgi:hypothetical protein